MMLWTDAYLADTGHLSTIQHGAYLLLLMTMWKNGGWLPNDDDKLASYARLKSDQWSKMAAVIRDFFTPEGGLLTQKRLSKEFQKINDLSALRKISSQLGVKAKTLKSLNRQQPNGNQMLTNLRIDKIGLLSIAEENGLARLSAPLEVSARLTALIKSKS